MNCLIRCSLATAVVFVVTALASAQNSSLMQPPGRSVQRSRVPVQSLAPPTIGVGDRVTNPVGRLPRLSQLPERSRYDGSAGQGGSAGPGDEGDQSEWSNENNPSYPYGATNPGYPAYPPTQRPAVSLDQASWTYQPAPALRTFQKNDVVTIRVDEITRMMAEGTAEQRKRTLSEAILTDWIWIHDFWFRPDPQDNGDPAIAAESNAQYRAESTMESRESLTFNIAATVVDIRPNGNLVLEARKAIRVNDNLWETSLSGICRAEDIGPDNVVLSKDLIDLEIRKEDRGHLRDGYSRGWLKRFVDRFGPF